MKTSLLRLFLVAAITLTAFVPGSHAEGANTSPPASPTLAEFKRLIEETKNEIKTNEPLATAAAEDLKNAKAAIPPVPTTIETAQQKLNGSQAKLDGARNRLAALEQAETLLNYQGPIRPIIIDFKRERDALPTEGDAKQKAQRSEMERKIAELEKADSALKGTSVPIPAAANKTELTSAGLFGIAIVVGGIIWLLIVMMKRWDTTSSQAGKEAGDDGAARVRLANSVTLGAMTFIVLVAVTILVFAGINAAIPPQGAEKTQLFFDMGKWIMGTILPVVGAWVGSVMAYYFGKENFKAGAENAEKLVKQLTPQQKLESQKAGDSGIAIADAAVSSIASGAKLEDMKLDTLRTNFTKGGKTYERLPILDDKGCPLACLHLSTLTKYTDGLSAADRADTSKLTLGELIKKFGWKPEASFATVLPTDNLTRVQSLLKASKECSDVFVTADGTKTKAAQRWITNEDIVKVAAA